MPLRNMIAALAVLAVAPVFADSIPVRDFARFAEYGSVKISPTGEYVAVTMPVEDKTGLAIVRLSDGKLTGAMYFAEKQHVGEFWWVGPERVVITITEQDGPLALPRYYGEMAGMDADGRYKVYLFGARARQAVTSTWGGGSRIQPQPMKVAENAWAYMVDPLPRDPQHAIIHVDRYEQQKTGVYPIFYKLDVRTGATVSLGGSPMPITPGSLDALTDPQGAVRYLVANDEHQKLITYFLPPGKAEWKQDDWQRVNTSDLAKATMMPLAFSGDGQRVYLSSDEDGGRQCLIENDPTTGARRALACHPACDLDEVVMSFDRKTPIATVFEPGAPTYKLVTSDHPDIQLLKSWLGTFPGQFVKPVSATLDGDKIVLLVYADRNPGEYYLYDRKTGNLAKLLSKRSWINPNQMAPQQPVTYAARDGTTIHAYLTLPNGVEPKKLPLIVMPHGGPFGIRDQWGWNADAQLLASRGYAVLQPNFRGSGGYGNAFQNAARYGWGTVMIDDISDGTRWAIEQGYADPKRICIYGWSYGGYAAMMSAVREPDLYRCVVDAAGIVDLKSSMRNADFSYYKQEKNYVPEFVGRNDEELAAQSPINYIDKLKAPVFIVHGEEDTRVPFSQAKMLRAALDKSGKPYEWLSEPREWHGFYLEKHRVEFYEKLLAFLDKYIGAPPPQQAAAGQ